MRGFNRVVVSGNATDKTSFSQTDNGTPTCTFTLASDRHTRDAVVTVFVKVNAYGRQLVELCRARLGRGSYVLVEGELMNRDGRLGELTEVRAKDLIFMAGEGAVHGS